MPKTARLDQILLQLGYVHVDEIARALRRQRAHGGRLGMNLVQLGAITEEQLLLALAEQFRMPTLKPREADIPAELVRRMPPEVVAGGHVVPLAWNEAQKVLSVAAANPGDETVLRRVKEAFGARGIRVGIAPEGLLALLGRRLVPEAPPTERARKVALPELFAEEASTPESDEQSRPARRKRTVMLTSLASRKDFLPPVFEREGISLTVVQDRASLEQALTGQPDRVLVSEEMSGPLAEWKERGLSLGGSDVVHFSSVSGALTENALPYPDTVRSLKSALRALADYRSGELGVSPPYGLIASDVAALASEMGLGRVPIDGLDLCVHLLLPHRAAAEPGAGEPFAAFASSLELATRLRFPWPMDGVLAGCHRALSGGESPAEVEDREIGLAARILALVWLRHQHLRPEGSSDEDRMLSLRTALRSEGGRFASIELVEAYIGIVAARGSLQDDGSDRQVLLVGGERLPRTLAPSLARVGREAVAATDLTDAQAMIQRRAPAAVVVDGEAFPEGLDRFIRITKLGGEVLVFVLTDSTDPALVLNLLDVGADDVFGPPHDVDLMAGRLNRAIRSRPLTPTAGSDDSRQFSASFEVFSFLDLIQMLGQGMKSARVDLERNGERAVIFMRRGRIVHAECGELTGEQAVHAVIAWDDEGSFTVREENDFPEATIQSSTESVLMEGLRLLDESRR